MNKKIQFIIIAAILVVAGVVFFDSLSTRIDKRPDNPYEYDLGEFTQVDTEHISHREVRQISIEGANPRSLTFFNGNLYLLSDDALRVITPEGRQTAGWAIDGTPRQVFVADDGIYILHENYIAKLDFEGKELNRSDFHDESYFFSSAVLLGNQLFIADAGNREIHILDPDLRLVNSFKGESGFSSLHGFILPSLHFHMAVNREGELWVTNPGVHRIQNYSAAGRMRRDWGEPSFGLNGFSGCCNPYFIAFLSDGRYVTSEKGIIRVKIHKESGEFESVVAAPEKFPNGEKAPAIVVDDKDQVWLLDFDKKMLRLFRPV